MRVSKEVILLSSPDFARLLSIRLDIVSFDILVVTVVSLASMVVVMSSLKVIKLLSVAINGISVFSILFS